MSQAELKELKDEIDKLKANALDMCLDSDMHKVQSNHNRLVKLCKIYKQETGVDLRSNSIIERKRSWRGN